MPDITITISYEAEAFGRVREAIGDGVAQAIDEVAEAVAIVARERHGYTNRSGDLEENTIATPHIGAFFADTLRSAAVGFTEYASYVESKPLFAFMGPAVRAVMPRIPSIVETELVRALMAAR